MITRFLTWVQERYRTEEAPETSDESGKLPRTYTIKDYFTEEPYLTRTVFPRILGVRPLLHRFHRPDADRHLHNHPWTRCLAIVLAGSYDEERINGKDKVKVAPGPGVAIGFVAKPRHVSWFNYIRHGDYHRITKLHGEVWTLFLCGERVSNWGFLTEKGYMMHKLYFIAERVRRRAEARRAAQVKRGVRDMSS